MHITKKVLAPIPDCYSVANVLIKDKPYLLFASESNDKCLAFGLHDFADSFTVWEHPGGTMSMVAIPDKPGEFLAIQRFYQLWNWEEARLVWVQIDEDRRSSVTELAVLPYLHRIDLLKRNGHVYLIACCVAAHKEQLEDWSHPGTVYGALLPDSIHAPLNLQVLHNGLYKNHGYAHIQKDGINTGFVTCDNGGFLFTPPSSAEDTWCIEKIIDGHFSDGDMIDIDGDGQMELALISPFHGNTYEIYKSINGCYEKVYEFPESADFFHVVRAGFLNGLPVFLGGSRGGRQKLFYVMFHQETGQYKTYVIDEGQGPSNACIVNSPQCDYIFSANRNTAQAVVYKLEY